MASRSSMLNRPGPLEHIELGPGERKITLVSDARVGDCIMMTVNKEDHTFGALMRNQLLRDPSVSFVAYRNPHPLEAKIEMRVQTKEEPPYKAVNNAIDALRETTRAVLDQLYQQQKLNK